MTDYAIVALEFASGEPCPHAGQYLQAADFDAHDGRGFVQWTEDPARAKRFPSMGEALAYWRTRSKVRPIRPDGRPNRPLTAASVVVEQLP